MDFEDSTLQILFSLDEFSTFSEIVNDICKKLPDIHGVLLTGSLVQRFKLPNPPKRYQSLTNEAIAYEKIRYRAKRKLFPHPQSDLDIWILTASAGGLENVPRTLDSRALELLDWYAKQEAPNMKTWISMKHERFDEFYKKEYLYTNSWREYNEVPYFAWGFKENLIDRIGCDLKNTREKINYYFQKSYPKEFLEVRAYPNIVFNLRPEKIIIDNKEDRTPFVYYMKDLLDHENNCIVLYARDDVSPLIYPFAEDGIALGEAVAQTIGWKSHYVKSIQSNGDRNVA